MGAGTFVVRKLWDGVAHVDCGGVCCALVLVLLLLGADIMLLESLMPLRLALFRWRHVTPAQASSIVSNSLPN